MYSLPFPILQLLILIEILSKLIQLVRPHFVQLIGELNVHMPSSCPPAAFGREQGFKTTMLCFGNPFDYRLVKLVFTYQCFAVDI